MLLGKGNELGWSRLIALFELQDMACCFCLAYAFTESKWLSMTLELVNLEFHAGTHQPS